MPLPQFLKYFFPSYDISKIDLFNPEDEREIITQILNHGDKKDIVWLFKNYDLLEIKKNILEPMRGCWEERSLNYWTKFLNLRLPKIIYQTALLSLKPRPKLIKKYFQSTNKMRIKG